LTTAAEVQPAGEPLPILWSGWLVSTARAPDGIVAWPDGLPGLGRSFGFRLADGLGVADFDGLAEADGIAGVPDGAGIQLAAGAATAVLSAWCPQPPNNAVTRADATITTRRLRTGRL
jgi:hypothetical protein